MFRQVGAFILLLIFMPVFIKPADTTEVTGKSLSFLPVTASTMIAQVGSMEITAEEFVISYEFGPAFYKREENSRKKCLDYMIYEKLLALKAYSLGYDTLQDVKDMLQEIRADIAGEQLYRRDILGIIKVDDIEVQKAVSEELVEVELQWIYSSDKKEMDSIYEEILQGKSFDTIFNNMLKPPLSENDRSLNSSLHKLKRKNPFIASVVSLLDSSRISRPINGADGWYIFKLKNRYTALLNTESGLSDLQYSIRRELAQLKADSVSNVYIHKLMTKNDPVIVRRIYNVLKGAFKDKNMSALDALSDSTLIRLTAGGIRIKDFLKWYSLRSQYINIDTRDPKRLDASLQSVIWNMVRGCVISNKAKEEGFYRDAEVEKQMKWWKDKLVYQKYKLILADGIKADSADRVYEYTKRIVRSIQSLKNKYKIRIHEDYLSRVNVEEEHNPRAIDVYSLKKGGTFIRPPYPTIDFEWQHWK